MTNLSNQSLLLVGQVAQVMVLDTDLDADRGTVEAVDLGMEGAAVQDMSLPVDLAMEGMGTVVHPYHLRLLITLVTAQNLNVE